jgi:hypothetical protein
MNRERAARATERGRHGAPGPERPGGGDLARSAIMSKEEP